MFAYVGGKKRPKKSLHAAVMALAEGYDGERAIFDTETGKIYALSGEETVILTPTEYSLVKEILGICALTIATSLPFPAKTVASKISQLGTQLAKDSAVVAAELYKDLRKKNGDSKSSGPVKAG